MRRRTGIVQFVVADTLATTKHIQCRTEHIHTLLTENHSRTALSNMIMLLIIAVCSVAVFRMFREKDQRSVDRRRRRLAAHKEVDNA